MEKREQIRKWFEGTNLAGYWFPTILCSLMILVLLNSLITDYGNLKNPSVAILVIVVCLIPHYLLYNKYKQIGNLPSEVQLDQWLEEDIQSVIKDRPYDKLGVLKEDLVAESLLVVGPIFWNISGFSQEDILTKKGKDGFNRYTTWTIQVFAFTENYLCSYKCHYNWLKNTYINESTNEFFYKDVVSVKTDTISSAYTLMNGQRLVHSEAFQLKLAGDEITVITNDASLNTSSVMVSKAEKAVQSIRAMLRDKKK
jgi:hypothetical protein